MPDNASEFIKCSNEDREIIGRLLYRYELPALLSVLADCSDGQAAGVLFGNPRPELSMFYRLIALRIRILAADVQLGLERSGR